MRRAVDFCLRFRLHRRTFSAGIYRTVLVIGVDSMSHMVDWSDSSTCILFGDGAGAVVLPGRIEGRYVCTGCSFGRQQKEMS